MQQVLFRIPGLNLPIFGFGAMLFVAFLACTWVAGRRARREGIAPELIQDLAIWLFVGGILGARILYLLQEAAPPGGWNLVDFLVQLPRIWDGGLILYGSVIGGLAAYAVAYWLVFRKKGVRTLNLADVIAPSVALGVMFGRLGCFLNGCCYGQVACAACLAYPVHFPLPAPPRYALVHEGLQTAAGFTLSEQQPGDGVRVGRVEPGSAADAAGLRDGDRVVAADGVELRDPGEEARRKLAEHFHDWERGKNSLTLAVVGAAGGGERTLTFSPRTLGLHPTQLYESVSMFLLFLLLTALFPLRRREGLVMAVLMMCYAVHRSLNELLRDDPRPVGLEAYTSYFLFAAGAALAVYVLLRGRPVTTPAAPQPAPVPAAV
jgi:phosphatidylglycerol:prolipoprotein diacylglycerol transferase